MPPYGNLTRCQTQSADLSPEHSVAEFVKEASCMGFTGKRSAVFALVPLLALGTAACSSDDDKGDKADSTAQSSAAGAPSGPAGSAASDGKRLTAAELKAALIESADVPGYDVQTGSPEDDGTGTETTDTAECRPLPALVAADQDHLPAQDATAAASKADNSSKVVSMISLGQFDGDQAEKYLTEARDALGKCTAPFVSIDDEGTKTTYTVEDNKKLSYGDDSLSVTFGMDGDPTTVVFVRSGSVLIQAMALDFDFEGPGTVDPTVPDDMLRTQYDKLVKAQKG